MNRPTADEQPPTDPPAAPDEASPETAGVEEEELSEEKTSEDGAPSETDALRAELREQTEEREALNDRLLRTAAELQNVRRRAAKEQSRRAAHAKASALRPMLDVMDDLERTLAAAEDARDKQDAEDAFQSLRDGVQMVAENLQRALAGQGVEAIEVEGQPFDESEHEAMMQQPAPEGVAPGTVVGEIRTGYRMGEERILRHSRVVVASEPPGSAGEAAGESEEAGA